MSSLPWDPEAVFSVYNTCMVLFTGYFLEFWNWQLHGILLSEGCSWALANTSESGRSQPVLWWQGKMFIVTPQIWKNEGLWRFIKKVENDHMCSLSIKGKLVEVAVVSQDGGWIPDWFQQWLICRCFLYVCRPGSKGRLNSPSEPNHLCLGSLLFSKFILGEMLW